jgi:hypothetical protein
MSNPNQVTQRVMDLCTYDDRLAAAEMQQAEAILRRAWLLPEGDQRLLHLFLRERRGLRDLAKLIGGNAGNLSRRVTRLTRRLCDPVVVALAEFPDKLPDKYQLIGIGHFALRKPIGVLVRELGISRNEIVAILGYLRAWAEMAGKRTAEAQSDT